MIVTGPCFEESYKIICTFGGREVEGIYISEQQALCISPQLPSFGRLTFKLMLLNATDIVVFEGERIFYACKQSQYSMSYTKIINDNTLNFSGSRK